jgi:hypothetical protein
MYTFFSSKSEQQKNSIVLFCCFLLPLFIYGQADSLKINQYDSLGNKHGLWISYYDSVSTPVVKEKINYRNGKKHGTAEYFRKNGEKGSRHTYHNDTLNGRMIIYESKSIQHYYVYDMGKKVWYGVVENGMLGYAHICIDGIPAFSYTQSDEGKFIGLGTVHTKLPKKSPE